MAPVNLIWGGGSIMNEAEFPTLKSIQDLLDILHAKGIKSIDTATIYASSEKRLGETHAAGRFAIDTKYPGGFGPEPENSVQETFNTVLGTSLSLLQTDQLDVYYIHAPDRRVPLEDLLAAVNAAHQAGKFKRFGLSNYLASEVDEVVRICREKNYVLPSVYQGNYSAVARKVETELFPTLRKHNISFYAYSPIAGGFLTKDVEKLVAGGEGRWDPESHIGKLYHALYNKPTMLEGLKLWEKISTETGIPKAELAYRWVVHHSILDGKFGDGVIFGSRTVEQLNQTFEGLSKGPLSAEIVAQVEQVWKVVEADSPLDNFNALNQ
ncbi:uncharacterized protein N7515_006277 [Penicillium bovifimosum]|uniref:NADP-dependent oxidoreductase domain-containing protein n=1 Tax=Penicillium bovifimosum TaxID=126998 RepID=A0A9W9GUR5_9EURO|nr:uncharacterized protein N7515_006277 [Penicillium bovifimosum]KAJ5130238.1 hypothetical protein N7515_006277 [Penicillium bovifimosum]